MGRESTCGPPLAQGIGECSRFLPALATGLRRDSVANVTAVVTPHKDELEGPVGSTPDALMHEVDQGLRQVLAL